MVRLARLIAVALGVAALGVLLTAVAFPALDAAHSDAGLLGLAAGLVVANFLLLRQGVRWAAKPAQVVRARREQAAAPIALHATH